MLNEQHAFRHELKYLCSAPELQIIESRLKSLCPLDKHLNGQSFYTIRSLYFDDMNNSCYYQNLDGVDPREKFRIRIYNGESRVINLELKSKLRGKTLKQSCPLTREQYDKILDKTIVRDLRDYPPLLRKLALQMQTVLLRPKVIVEYERTPFVYPIGNVRITLDKNISASNAKDDFFEKRIHKRPVLQAGQHLLEVKFDELLPDFIYRNLQLQNLQSTAFSKYCLCRKYDLGDYL